MKLLRLTSLVLVFCGLVPAADGGPQVDDGARAVAGVPRILYASDWSGTSQIYAVDPSGRRATGQLTFGRAPACLPGNPCGFAAPSPSPDGRRVLFWDYSVQGPFRSSLFASLADGRQRHRLGMLRSYPHEAVWAPDSRRIAYTARDGIHVTTADGSSDRRVRLDDKDQAPEWSGDGRWLGFLNKERPDGLAVLVARGGVVRTVARSDQSVSFRWAPHGNQLAYTTSHGLFIVRPAATGRRRIAEAVSAYAWSPDGRLLAFVDEDGLKLADVVRHSINGLSAGRARELAWSPDGRRVAVTGTDARVRVVFVATGASRDLGIDHARELAWSPDSRSLAYGVATGATADFGESVDVRVTTLSGVTRTAVAGAGAFGGAIRGYAWTRPSPKVRYRPTTSRMLAAISPERVVAPWPIERIASDGSRVAYTACGHLFVWTPSAGEVSQREATTSLSPACSGPTYYTSYKLYSLALAGDRVAYGTVFGGNGRVWWLGGTRGAHETFSLGHGFSTNGPAYSGDVVGELTGSGDRLVFSSWKEAFGPSPGTAVTTAQEVRLALPLGCPCPALASTAGPLLPFDVDDGRVLAGGDNETWLVDGNGTRLLAIPVSASAAQLSGRDLVLVRRGELRHYDATGALLYVWPLSDVAAGRECASPNPNRCGRAQSELVLEDAARGLVTYVLDGQVHVLRLADGVDAVVGAGTLARFIDAGLVYVDGARLQLVRFDRLPPR